MYGQVGRLDIKSRAAKSTANTQRRWSLSPRRRNGRLSAVVPVRVAACARSCLSCLRVPALGLPRRWARGRRARLIGCPGSAQFVRLPSARCSLLAPAVLRLRLPLPCPGPATLPQLSHSSPLPGQPPVTRFTPLLRPALSLSLSSRQIPPSPRPCTPAPPVILLPNTPSPKPGSPAAVRPGPPRASHTPISSSKPPFGLHLPPHANRSRLPCAPSESLTLHTTHRALAPPHSTILLAPRRRRPRP